MSGSNLHSRGSSPPMFARKVFPRTQYLSSEPKPANVWEHKQTFVIHLSNVKHYHKHTIRARNKDRKSIVLRA